MIEPSTGAEPMVIRPIRPEDWELLQSFHVGLSGDSVRNRYFGAHPVLTDAEARGLASPTSATGAALVAVVDGTLVGVGRYIRLTDPTTAEVAFVVDDARQGQGIGTTLLTGLARVGWGAGVRRFVADTLTSNRAMLDVFFHTPSAVAVESTSRSGSVVHLVMSVASAAGTAPA